MLPCISEALIGTCAPQVVVDAQTWVEHLPHTILAVFIKKDPQKPNRAVTAELDDAKAARKREYLEQKRRDAAKYCQDVHTLLLSDYGLTSGQVPLVEYDPGGWLEGGGLANPNTDSSPFRDISPA